MLHGLWLPEMTIRQGQVLGDFYHPLMGGMSRTDGSRADP